MRLSQLVTLTALLTVTLVGCSTTQKTEGQGMVSVIAQNVVRIAGARAVRDLDLSEVKDRKVFVDVSGFVDDFNKGYILNLIRNEVEASGGTLPNRDQAELLVEVAVNSAGNDRGNSDYFIGGADRTEGGVDLTITTRNLATGERVARQTIRGQAKYQQGSLLGVTGSGAYFVMDGGDWDLVEDPARYR